MKNEVLQQDLTQTENRPGAVFAIHLLMAENIQMPDKTEFENVLKKHLGEIECFSYDPNSACFTANEYRIHFEKEGITAHPQLMITSCSEIQKPIMDEVARTQLWDCPNADEILESCKFQVMAVDLLASGLNYKDRARMLTAYIEALAELYPACKAIVFESSKKMFPREAILSCTLPENERFIHYAVNIRFFRIQGTEDMLVDSVGMSTLFLPDVQYHFHGMEPNAVVNHAYDVLYYIYEHDNPIEDGNTMTGLKDGKPDSQVRWKLQYEQALIQPVREVIDVNMLELASGNRE